MEYEKMDYMITPLYELAEYKSILEAVKGTANTVCITGPSDSQKAHITYAICRHINCKALFVTFNEIQARRMYEDFSFFFGERALLFPTKEIIYYDVEAKSNDNIFRRIAVLNKILEGEYDVIIASVEAISHKLMPSHIFSHNILHIEWGMREDLENLTKKLINMGYERRDMVEGRGQFAIRGGILDIYSVDKEDPIRIEMFGDEIDSIRVFDVLSQRSIDKKLKDEILPAKEILYTLQTKGEIIEQIKKDLNTHINNLLRRGRDTSNDTYPSVLLNTNIGTDFNITEQTRTNIEQDINRLETGRHFPGIDRYIPYILKDPGFISDYMGHFGEKPIVFLDEPSKIYQRMEDLIFEHNELCKNLLEGGRILPSNFDIYYDGNSIYRKFEKEKKIHFTTLLTAATNVAKTTATDAINNTTTTTAINDADVTASISDVDTSAATTADVATFAISATATEHFGINKEKNGDTGEYKDMNSDSNRFGDRYSFGDRYRGKDKDKDRDMDKGRHNDKKKDKDIANFNILSGQISPYHGFIDILVNDITKWKENNSRVLILAGPRSRGEKLMEELSSNNIESVYFEKNDIEAPSISSGKMELLPGKVVITQGSLNKGFEYPSIGLVVISDKEIFSSFKKTGKLRKKGIKGIKGIKIDLFTDLNPGDYVVHQTNGIGEYIGMETLTVDNVNRDYLKIRYQGGDYLYIPTSNLDTIQKYIGSEGRTPKLSKLGGSDWVKTKTKVKESIRKLAEELVKLYAKRSAIRGFSFSKDTIWQKQFEDSFPYEETEDQIRTIEEIKKDMESNEPMDRLLCGDVGYGKTEVALRALFKAAMDGKQAAFLVPTTVLAQQHYNTFKERLKDFPLTVEMISRFRTKAEQNKILKDLKKGYVDVLIGTHRLLQKDMEFKNLGLLIVDEEQRFGVMQKERLKSMKSNVDVLTLTATPIPRTLHMSLSGIRNISTIEEPPENRYPVQTFVMEYNENIVADAIIRELGRGGQVFYLYNRVKTIDIKSSQIQALVPEARVDIAHGQMEERRLENVMISFLNREFDILVCTTIIESGLDMPNVNTIIVEDGDKMGLAQLYQLRGRVGRSDRVAYAYITYKKDKVLTEVAEKRLQAIKEFTEFGSGFKIAMRDLEIRGAGNLLGAQQHGHIESIGYEMYCRLLDESVKELRGENSADKDVEVTIDLKISAYIDNQYISHEIQKIEMYKKIASIQDEDDVMDIRDELLDRYGEPPQFVENLLQIAYIRALAGSLNLTTITEKGDFVIFQLKDEKSIGIETMGRMAAKYKGQIFFNLGANPHISYKRNKERILDIIKIILHDIKSFEQKQKIDV